MRRSLKMNTVHRIGLSMLAAAAVVFYALQHQAETRLRRENQSLRRELEEELSRRRAPDVSAGANAMGEEGRSELLRLRDEATQLREQVREMAALTRENQKLAASVKDTKGREEAIFIKKKPADALPQDIHPKDSWAFRGYATPEAALESFFWAEANEDKVEGRKRRTADFRITDRRQLSDDEMILTFYTSWYDADGHIHFNDFSPAVMQRVGGEWKVTDKHPPSD